MRAAAAEWVEGKLRTERRATVVESGLAVAASIPVTAVTLAVVAWMVFLVGRWTWPMGWTSAWAVSGVLSAVFVSAHALRYAGVAGSEPGVSSPRVSSALGLALVSIGSMRYFGSRSVWNDAVRKHGVEAGASAGEGLMSLLLCGPALAIAGWERFRRLQALATVDADACADVVALCLERGKRVELAELEQLLPHVSVTQLRHDLLLFDGVRLLAGPPAAVSLGSSANEQLTELLQQYRPPAVLRSLSA